ncbi:MAG: hypothetical protein QOE58_2030 [Actinomycetota bacterium]|nr:hypothetical protein [Actinomycetota bacterium]
MPEPFVIEGVRTAIGRYGGSLAHVTTLRRWWSAKPRSRSSLTSGRWTRSRVADSRTRSSRCP